MAQGIKNLSVNAGDTGSISDPRRSHMTWNNEAWVSPLLSLCSRALELQYICIFSFYARFFFFSSHAGSSCAPEPWSCNDWSLCALQSVFTARESASTWRPSMAGKKKKECIETEDTNIFQYCVADRSLIDYSVVVLGNHFKIKFQASEFYELCWEMLLLRRKYCSPFLFSRKVS